MISSKDPHRLDNKKHSSELCDFVAKSLVKEPSERPSCA